MIDIRNIQPNESIAVDTTVKIAMSRGFDAYDAAIAVSGRLKNAGESFVLDAQGVCPMVTMCSRCLQPVKHQLSFRINESFVEEEEEGAVLGDGEDIRFLDKTIDIFPAVQRNFFPNIPMKPLCGADCAGLCQRCGKNLNEGNCDCEGEVVNEQFRELLQFFDD